MKFRAASARERIRNIFPYIYTYINKKLIYDLIITDT